MDLQELEKYRPIPRGGLRILAWLAFCLLFGVGFAFLFRWVLPGPSNFWVGWALASTAMLVSVMRHMRLYDYWRRNVRGYEACFWIDKDEGVDPDVSIWVEEMRRPPYWAPCELNGRGKIFFRVPLGGWFRKQGLLYSIRAAGESSERAPFRAWRIIVRQPVTDPLVDTCIEVIDRKGDRIPLTVSETLRFAAWLSAGGFQEWRHEVPYLLRAVREGRAERDEAVRQRDHAFLAMLKANAAIKETSRFQKSKDARRIREGLIRDILEIAPADHPLQSVLREEQSGNQSAAAAEAREGG